MCRYFPAPARSPGALHLRFSFHRPANLTRLSSSPKPLLPLPLLRCDFTLISSAQRETTPSSNMRPLSFACRILVAFLCLAGSLYAQDASEFARNFPPELSFTETYADEVKIGH